MRISLLIFACFLIVMALPFIPYDLNLNDLSVSDYKGALPQLHVFTVICAVLLIVASVCTIYSMKQKLRGELVIKQKNKNLAVVYQAIGFWAAFTVTTQLLSKDFIYHFTNTTAYFLIIMLTILVYHLFCKWYIRRKRPAKISFNGTKLFVRSFLKARELQIDNLKSIQLNARRNTLTLQFREGLNNIRFNLSDYHKEDIQQLINRISDKKPDLWLQLLSSDIK